MFAFMIAGHVLAVLACKPVSVDPLCPRAHCSYISVAKAPSLTFRFCPIVRAKLIEMQSMKCGVSRPLAAGNVARIPRSTAARAATAEAAPVSAEVADICINTIRFLAIDAVNKANSGHPGAPMGCAPMSFVLFNEAMKYNPKNPSFLNRDRFVLSAGHASMLQYAMMHLAGYDSVSVRSISLKTCRYSL